jgi:iron complex outermembrane recepter protein
MLSKRIWHIFAFLMVHLAAFGQDGPSQIQLVSEETNQPIVFAYYIYGGQQGSSDEKGLIHIAFVPGEELLISHIGFGKKTFLPQSVEQAFKNGVLQVPPGKPVSLQPVTILALHGHNLPIDLNESDRLSHDAGSVLTRLPAISAIKKSGSYGFDPVLRGFKYDQLNIVIDGLQSAAAACPNRMDPPASHVPLNQMEKVEIHKGPHALRYGPSFGGVINFIPGKPAFGERKTLGRVASAYEHNGDVYRMEGLVGNVRDKTALYMKGMWSEGFDYKDGHGMTVPSQFKKGSIGMHGVYRLTDVQQLDWSVARNFARKVDFAGLPMDLISDDSWLLRAGHTVHYNKKIKTWSTAAFLSMVDHLMDNMSKELTPRMVDAFTSASTKSYGGRTEFNLELDRGRAYVGGDIKIEEATGYRTREFLMGPNTGTVAVDNVWQGAKINRSGVFTEYHVHLDPNHFTVSARLDLNHATIRQTATEYESIHVKDAIVQVNPSVSLGISRELAENIDIGLWLGRGQRSGSITERFINFFPVGLDPYELIGNIDLKPEVNNQADLSLNIKTERFRVSGNVFYSWLQQFISSEIRPDLSPRMAASPGVRMFTNIQNADMTGFEISWIQAWPMNLQHHLDAAYVYGKNLKKGEPLPEIPPLDIRLRVSGKYLDNKLLPEISLRQVFAQKRVSPSFGEGVTNSFLLAGVNVSYLFHPHVKFTGGVENLFNRAYHEHLNRRFSGTDRYIYNHGRNIFAAIVYKLGPG